MRRMKPIDSELLLNDNGVFVCLQQYVWRCSHCQHDGLYYAEPDMAKTDPRKQPICWDCQPFGVPMEPVDVRST